MRDFRINFVDLVPLRISVVHFVCTLNFQNADTISIQFCDFIEFIYLIMCITIHLANLHDTKLIRRRHGTLVQYLLCNLRRLSGSINYFWSPNNS